ncbi:protein wwc2 [Plakobranchus ocellatus]|uniref:Protein wwc2 n=1 Tax=Plakobranchus ocellatus TaxID=259542 RepID=A0AAV4AWJ4_9GAST|nr:protein wwc2 [Plakobranchus ocellatus]
MFQFSSSGKFEGKRGRGRQREKIMDGLSTWLGPGKVSDILAAALAQIKEELLRRASGSSPDVSTLSLAQDKQDMASQTDLRGEFNLNQSRLFAEKTRMRLQYDEAHRKLEELKIRLANLEDRMVPGQPESDKDRLLLLQEKEQLLRELRSIDPKGRSEEEMASVRQRILKLESDLRHAQEFSNKQIQQRITLHDEKSAILHQLTETTKLTSYLESQLKSLSLSTLSVSSGSSLGSLGSLSAGSRGSLNSLSTMDIYGSSSVGGQMMAGEDGLDIYGPSLQDLHQRVEKLLQGHSMSPIQEAHSGVPVDQDMTEAATSNYIQAVLRGSQELNDPTSSTNSNISSSNGFTSSNAAATPNAHSSNAMSGGNLLPSSGASLPQQALSPSMPTTSSSSSSSPPHPSASSVYGLGGPPPTYEQHMNALEQRQLPLQPVLQSQHPQQVSVGCNGNLSNTNSTGGETSGPGLPPWSFGTTSLNDLNPSVANINSTDHSASLTHASVPPSDTNPQMSHQNNQNLPTLVEQSLPDLLSQNQMLSSFLNSVDKPSVVPDQQYLLSLLNQRHLEFTASPPSLPAPMAAQLQQQPSSPPSLTPLYSNGNTLTQTSAPTTPKSLNTSSSTLESSPPVDPNLLNNPTLVGTATNKQIQNVCEPALNPPLSPISESSSGVGNNLSGGNTRSVSAAVSDESVAGDSGVFEASVKRTGYIDKVLESNMESAQIQIKLKYEGLEKQLVVGIEQARNLAVLPFHKDSCVCIKAALLPSQAMCLETKPLHELKSPKFAEQFRMNLAEHKLFSKTLQVHVWSLSQAKGEECLGCAQVSLADFDPRSVSLRWYNVLSFRFMQQSDLKSGRSSSSSSSHNDNSTNQQKQRASSPGLAPDSKAWSGSTPRSRPSSTSSSSGGGNKLSTSTASYSRAKQKQSQDRVHKLLEASSAKLMQASSAVSDDQSSGGDSGGHRLLIRNSGKPHNAGIISLKEESSDESTIISSQTSTLTRNHCPEDMKNHMEGSQFFEDDVNAEDDDDEDDANEEGKDHAYDAMIQEVLDELADSVDNYDEDGEDDDFSESDFGGAIAGGAGMMVPMADKETNTEKGEYRLRETKRRGSHHHHHRHHHHHHHHPHSLQQQQQLQAQLRNSTIRRSQTFSPACRQQPPGYICKLNRSDSDGSMPLYKRTPFQRNTATRRSLRWKRTDGSIGLVPLPEKGSAHAQIPFRTSLDLELDLQASHTRLSHLYDEINRLRELKRTLETSKNKGELELPEWLSENEKFHRLLSMAERLQQHMPAGGSAEQPDLMSRQDRRAEHLMKKVTKDVQRMRQGTQQSRMFNFREKMAFVTSANMDVPVIPSEVLHPEGAGRRLEGFNDSSEMPSNFGGAQLSSSTASLSSSASSLVQVPCSSSRGAPEPGMLQNPCSLTGSSGRPAVPPISLLQQSNQVVLESGSGDDQTLRTLDPSDGIPPPPPYPSSLLSQLPVSSLQQKVSPSIGTIPHSESSPTKSLTAINNTSTSSSSSLSLLASSASSLPSTMLATGVQSATYKELVNTVKIVPAQGTGADNQLSRSSPAVSLSRSNSSAGNKANPANDSNTATSLSPFFMDSRVGEEV